MYHMQNLVACICISDRVLCILCQDPYLQHGSRLYRLPDVVCGGRSLEAGWNGGGGPAPAGGWGAADRHTGAPSEGAQGAGRGARGG